MGPLFAELCGVPLGLRRSEHFASAERHPNLTTLLCFKNLAGTTYDLSDTRRTWDLAHWAKGLCTGEIFRVRLSYTKHQRQRVAHEVVAGLGYQLMSFVLWINIINGSGWAREKG